MEITPPLKVDLKKLEYPGAAEHNCQVLLKRSAVLHVSITDSQ